MQISKIIKRIVSRRVLMHLVFWILMTLIIFTTENWENGPTIHWEMLSHFSIAFVLFAIASYFNLYYLIPRYFKTRRFLKYALLLLLTMLIDAALITICKQIGEHICLTLPENWHHHEPFQAHFFFHMLSGVFLFVLLTSFFYVLEEWIRFQGITIKMQEIERQKVQSELQALKAQINPHFLFNTLNNLYSHSLENSPKTPEMILKLSSLMSYILYDCHEDRVSIANELEFIGNYIELEKLRFEDQLAVQLHIDQHCDHCKIVPLLLIPFIENAFKHGGSTGQNKRMVDISIIINEHELRFSVKNSIDANVVINQRTKDSGIGIENVKKRLDLLYSQQHSLYISKNEQEFSVELTITNYGN